jgi:hypothetical protein
MSKGCVVWLCGALVVLLVVILTWGGSSELALHLGLGWLIFLRFVLPKVAIDWSATTIALLCLAGLALGLHLFLRWLARQIAQARHPQQPPGAAWQARWTGMILALVLLLFVTGISAVGIAHQTAWLATSPEPVVGRLGGLLDLAHDRMSSSNNLKQIGVAVHSYHDVHKALLPGGTFDAQGNGLHGWQTLLLPYIEQDNLFKAIDLKSPWHSARNAPLLRRPIYCYQHSSVSQTSDDAGFSLSHYAANARVLGAKPITLADIPNGTKNTILAGEVWTAYKPWGHPANWRDPARGLRTTQDSFGSPQQTADSVLFLMLDGSVRSVAHTVSRATLEAASNPDRNGPMPDDW